MKVTLVELRNIVRQRIIASRSGESTLKEYINEFLGIGKKKKKVAPHKFTPAFGGGGGGGGGYDDDFDATDDYEVFGAGGDPRPASARHPEQYMKDQPEEEDMTPEDIEAAELEGDDEDLDVDVVDDDYDDGDDEGDDEGDDDDDD